MKNQLYYLTITNFLNIKSSAFHECAYEQLKHDDSPKDRTIDSSDKGSPETSGEQIDKDTEDDGIQGKSNLADNRYNTQDDGSMKEQGDNISEQEFETDASKDDSVTDADQSISDPDPRNT